MNSGFTLSTLAAFGLLLAAGCSEVPADSRGDPGPDRPSQPSTIGKTLSDSQVRAIARSHSYDSNRVDAKLRELVAPYQRVRTHVSADRGIGLTIVDQDGRKLDLGVMASAERPPKYSEVAFGPKLVPLTEDTRRMLVSILVQHRPPTNANDEALILLSGAR